MPSTAARLSQEPLLTVPFVSLSWSCFFLIVRFARGSADPILRILGGGRRAAGSSGEISNHSCDICAYSACYVSLISIIAAVYRMPIYMLRTVHGYGGIPKRSSPMTLQRDQNNPCVYTCSAQPCVTCVLKQASGGLGTPWSQESTFSFRLTSFTFHGNSFESQTLRSLAAYEWNLHPVHPVLHKGVLCVIRPQRCR